MTNNEIFEIVFFEDEYQNVPMMVCEPDLESFTEAIKSFSKKISDKEIPSLFSTIVKNTTTAFRRKLSSGHVVHLRIKAGVSEADVQAYNNANKKSIKEHETNETKVSKPTLKSVCKRKATNKTKVSKPTLKSVRKRKATKTRKTTQRKKRA